MLSTTNSRFTLIARAAVIDTALWSNTASCTACAVKVRFSSQPPVLQGGTIRNYWSCLDRSIIDSRHVKSIVNTAYALAARYAALCSPFQTDTAICAQQSSWIFATWLVCSTET